MRENNQNKENSGVIDVSYRLHLHCVWQYAKAYLFEIRAAYKLLCWAYCLWWRE